MNLQTAPHAGAAPAGIAVTTPIREFLAFWLGSEEYGIDILRVQEIRSYERPTRIAKAPDYLKGVMNLRGVIVPIIDLRLRLELEPADYGRLTVVIVLNIGRRVIGVVVDSVSDVIALAPQHLRAVPPLYAGLASEHLLAIGTVDERRLILVDIERLLSGTEIGLVEPSLQ